MKPFSKILGTAVALLIAMPVTASEDAKAEQSAAPAAAKHYSIQDTVIGDMLADPAAKAVLDKPIPGLSDNPSIGAVAGMTLRAIQPMAADKIPVEKLDAVDAERARIGAK